MRRTVFMLAAASLVLGATELTAQVKPNFAGKWTVVVDPNAPAPTGRGGGRGGWGTDPVITQDDKTLTVTRTTQAGEVKTVYNLDGSDSKNTMNMGGNAVESVSKATWDGTKLNVTTTTSFNGNAMTSSLVISLDATGNLVLQSTGAGRGGGAPVTTTMTYKKA